MRSLEEIIHINSQPDPDAYVLGRRSQKPIFEGEIPSKKIGITPIAEFTRKGEDNEKK